MPQTDTPIRNSVRAYIRRGDEILVQLKKNDNGDTRYALPGGAVDPGETLADGLKRECMEEIGAPVEIVDLLYLADYFKPLTTDPPGTRQQVEFIFRCTVADDYVAQNGPKPDRRQVDVVWLPVSALPESGMTPREIRDVLIDMELTAGGATAPVYLGRVE